MLGISIIPAFSFAATDACRAMNPVNDGNTHQYTCQSKSDKNINKDLCGGDGSTNSRPGASCDNPTTSENEGNYLVCHRCVCNAPKKWINGKCTIQCDEAKGEKLEGDKCVSKCRTDQVRKEQSCKCPDGKSEQNGKCVDENK
jgi:hypothetical protein